MENQRSFEFDVFLFSFVHLKVVKAYAVTWLDYFRAQICVPWFCYAILHVYLFETNVLMKLTRKTSTNITPLFASNLLQNAKIATCLHHCVVPWSGKYQLTLHKKERLVRVVICHVVLPTDGEMRRFMVIDWVSSLHYFLFRVKKKWVTFSRYQTAEPLCRAPRANSHFRRCFEPFLSAQNPNIRCSTISISIKKLWKYSPIKIWIERIISSHWLQAWLTEFIVDTNVTTLIFVNTELRPVSKQTLSRALRLI